jgi:hypothetical protein
MKKKRKEKEKSSEGGCNEGFRNLLDSTCASCAYSFDESKWFNWATGNAAAAGADD